MLLAGCSLGNHAAPAPTTHVRTAAVRTTGLPGPPSAIALGFSSVWLPTNGHVVRVDARTQQIAANIPAPGVAEDSRIAVTASGVWVTGSGTPVVVRIDPDANRVIGVVKLPRGLLPTSIAAGPGGVWVGAGGHKKEPRVYPIDLVTNRVGRMVPMPNLSGPTSMVLVRKDLWTGNPFTNVPAGSSHAEVSGPGSVTAGSGVIWLEEYQAHQRPQLSAIDPRTGDTGRTIRFPAGYAQAFGRDQGWVVRWAADRSDPGTLITVDLHTGHILSWRKVGGTPTGVAVGYGSVWVANFGDSTLTRITE